MVAQRKRVWFLIILLLAGCVKPASVPPEQGPFTQVTSFWEATPGSGEGEKGRTPAALSSATGAAAQPTEVPSEYPVEEIELAGPAASPQAEISGMAWFSDTLILLPQYPSRFGSSKDGAVFALTKAQINDYLDGVNTVPLTPRLVTLDSGGLEKKLYGYEGFEAIAFIGQRVFLTIETHTDLLRLKMLGYLVSGSMAPDLSELRLNSSSLAEIRPQADLPNMADEAIVATSQRLVTLYEANGVNDNPSPVAHLFDLNLNLQGSIKLEHIEYRITDATPPDPYGRFWAINVYYPGDTQLKPAPDALTEKYGKGLTHSRYKTVERLVEFQFTEYGIQLAPIPPIWLELIDDQNSRDWEALARLDGRGFLLATDQYPRTIFGFVAYP